MSDTRDRRSFLSALASIGGAAALAGRSSEAAAQAQAPARPDGPWDFTWIDSFKGKHKQLFDCGSSDITSDTRPIRFVTNYLDTNRDALHLEPPDVNTVVGIARSAFPINASDALWQKYKLGELWKINDPATREPAVRNIFMDGADGVKALQARGTVFWQCNIALTVVVQQLARASGQQAADVRTEVLAGLNAGVKVVPSHVLALGLVQEKGFTYSYVKP
jgi:hypothetical protein